MNDLQAACRHEAFFYRGERDFLAGVLPFLRAGQWSGERMLVAVPEPRLRLVRAALGENAEQVEFVDMARVGANPARIISVWQRFVQRARAEGRPVRGVGEPLWAGRRPAEVAECQLHEALVNLVLPAAAPVWLRCPYDAGALPAVILEDAAASHPIVVQNGRPRASRCYAGEPAMRARFRRSLPAPSGVPVQLRVTAANSSAAADLVHAHAGAAGVAAGARQDLLVAIEQLIAGSLRRGGGEGVVRIWSEPGALVCEIGDQGHLPDPLAGRVAPSSPAGDQALAAANRLCDLVQVRSSPTGTTVRVHTWLAAGSLPDRGAAGEGARHEGRRPEPAPATRGSPLGHLRVLAADVDGSVLAPGPVSAELIDALDRARAGGLRVIAVTARRLAELDLDHPELRRHVDATVAENGAVLQVGGGTRLLAPPAATELIEALTQHRIPHRVGEVVVECDRADAHRVLDVLQQAGLDHQIVRTRRALLLLPPGATKSSGLAVALSEFGMSRHNVLGVGDAEDDGPPLDACEIGVTVGRAPPALRSRVDITLPGATGTGVTELLTGHFFEPATTLSSRRWRLTLGHDHNGRPVQLPASPATLLISGASGSGKSFLTGLIAEQLTGLEYSCLLLDPEGDHVGLQRLPGVVTVGGDGALPSPGVVQKLLSAGPRTVVLDLSQQPLPHPGPLRTDGLPAQLHDYLTGLVDAIQDGRRHGGGPQWLLIDEADSFFAADGPLLPLLAPGWGLCLTTYRPDRLAPAARAAVHWTLRTKDRHSIGGAALLPADPSAPAIRLTVGPRRSPHARHQHKYAAGDGPTGRSFLFRDDHGPVGVQAGNVGQFLTALSQAPPSVLTHHMRLGDFARWVDDVLGDATLADLVRAVERVVAAGGDPGPLRDTLVALLHGRYLPER